MEGREISGGDRLNVSGLSKLARSMNDGGSFAERLLRGFRPYICPFDVLIGCVPKNSTVLDVGCGSGLFLGLLHATGSLRSGVGFDFSPKAIRTARSLNLRQVQFELLDATSDWPSEPATFDVVSLIDVMHHVHPSKHLEVLRTAAKRISPGGILLYKDMCREPRWRAWANRLHDLILARQWIHYAPVRMVEEWAAASGLSLESSADIKMLWYGHELRVFRK